MAKLAPMLLYSAAGLCLFLMLLNRVLLLRPDSRLKTLAILAAFLLLIGGAAFFGWTHPHGPWVFAPVTVLGLIAIGEVRRAVIRRACAGSPHVEATRSPIRLARPFTTTDLVCRRYEVSCAKWAGPALRIVHLTDLHVNPRIPFEFYEQAFRVAEQGQADLAFITGDFVSDRASVPALRQLLRPLGRHGTFAVLGNHDYWVGADGVRAAVRDAGLTLLENESLTLPVAGQSLRISGLDFPWNKSGNSVPPSASGELHLVLSHTPDNIYRIARSGADCVFSGHNHAGQLRVPLLGSVIVPSVYGRRFDHGHFVVNGTHLFVSSGIGAASPPFRVYCQPEVLIVEVSGAERLGGTQGQGA